MSSISQQDKFHWINWNRCISECSYRNYKTLLNGVIKLREIIQIIDYAFNIMMQERMGPVHMICKRYYDGRI